MGVLSTTKSVEKGHDLSQSLRIEKAHFLRGNRPIVGCPIKPYICLFDPNAKRETLPLDPAACAIHERIAAKEAAEAAAAAAARNGIVNSSEPSEEGLSLREDNDVSGRPGLSASIHSRRSQKFGKLFEAKDDDKRIKYRWYRGPRVYNCVFHPQRPGVVRDVARSLRFYCSAECLANGYRHLPDDQCAMVPDPSDDDLMYCPWLIDHKPEVFGGRDKRSCWQLISESAEYIPTQNDAERILAVEVVVADDPKLLEKSLNGRSQSLTMKKRRTSDSVPVGLINGKTPPVLASRAGKNSKNSVILMTGPTFDSQSYTPPLREMLSVYGALEHIQAGQAIKLLNWNILADVYASEQLYDYCPSWALSWGYRRHLILKQIAALEGDIVCLQEVQSDHLEADVWPEMEKLGFGYVYGAKTRSFFTRQLNQEGCAVFYRKSRFVLRESIIVEFDTEAKRQFSHDKIALHRLSKGNVAVLCILEDMRFSNRPLVVVNTHIIADVESCDVKVWQTQTLLDFASDFMANRNLNPANTPLVICGDFNSQPDSAVYELLASGMMGQPVEDPAKVLSTRNLGHTMPLQSMHVAVVGHEASITNFTSRFQGTLDYIFFTKSCLQGLAVSNGYQIEDLQHDTALPSPSQPSDHILTVGVFAYS